MMLRFSLLVTCFCVVAFAGCGNKTTTPSTTTTAATPVSSAPYTVYWVDTNGKKLPTPIIGMAVDTGITCLQSDERPCMDSEGIVPVALGGRKGQTVVNGALARCWRTMGIPKKMQLVAGKSSLHPNYTAYRRDNTVVLLARGAATAACAQWRVSPQQAAQVKQPNPPAKIVRTKHGVKIVLQ